MKAYKTPLIDKDLETLIVDSQLGRLESIKVSEIGGLIGRIEKQLIDRKVIHLVGLQF